MNRIGNSAADIPQPDPLREGNCISTFADFRISSAIQKPGSGIHNFLVGYLYPVQIRQDGSTRIVKIYVLIPRVRHEFRDCLNVGVMFPELLLHIIHVRRDIEAEAAAQQQSKQAA